jgi:hypothetical protein
LKKTLNHSCLLCAAQVPLLPLLLRFFAFLASCRTS